MNTKKLLSIFFMMITALLFVQAQDFDLDNFSGDMKTSKGPNAQKFGHFLLGFGILVDQPEGDREIKYLPSNNIEIGYRYKYKMGNVLAAGWEISYARLKFAYEQPESNIPSFLSQSADKEFLRLHQLKPGLYFRINFDPNRGNVMGKFLDVGGYGAFNFGRNYYLEFQDNIQDAKRRKVIYSGLEDVEQFSYGVSARLGINSMVLFARYRLSDLVNNDESSTGEPPRIVVGIQTGIHR